MKTRHKQEVARRRQQVWRELKVAVGLGPARRRALTQARKYPAQLGRAPLGIFSPLVRLSSFSLWPWLWLGISVFKSVLAFLHSRCVKRSQVITMTRSICLQASCDETLGLVV